MTNRYRSLGGKLITIGILRRLQIQKLIRGKEIFKGQFPILEIICMNEGCTQKFIAESLMVSQASIALSVKRLVKAGMLEKTVDDQNLRCNRIYPTEKGRAVKDELAAMHRSVDEMIFKGFTKDEIEQIDTLFEKIINNLSEDRKGKISICALCRELEEAEKGGKAECSD
ncbi:MAG: winged helix-turn-helix transcriptional regulator [Christensenellaceae bacterium]|nr:winged helix-turn-helix transcriptional regulator [Christensenellaceae bacterium]